MSERKKISIVAGELENPRLLKLFESLQSIADVTVYAFNRARLLDNHRSSLKLRLFEPVNEMPGFIRGLDAEIAGSDLIIGIESSRLSSFQALRHALKVNCPFVCFVTESLPFMYSGFANIRAIQEDVFTNATHFLALSHLAAASLKREGISDAKIDVVSPSLDQARFKVDQARKSKFRKHVGLAEDSLVCLYQAPMVEASRHLEVIKALDYLRRCRAPSFEKFRVVFAGIGPTSQDIKYRCVDLGLAHQVVFLHQDPEPFLQDLYSASDLVMAGPSDELDQSSQAGAPFNILECNLAGAVPIAVAGSVSAELLSDVAQEISSFSYHHIAEAFLKQLSIAHEGKRPTIESIVSGRYKSSIASVSGAASSGILIERVAQLMETKNGMTLIEDFKKMLADIDKDTKRGMEKNSLVRIEDLLLRGTQDIRVRAELFRAKGDALYSTGNYEEAMNSYSDATHLDDKNLAALRGLGFVAWSSHSNEDALTFFRRALALNESDPRTLLGIGLVFRRISLFEDSIFWLEKALDHEEVRNTALSGFLQACSASPRANLAIAALNRAIEIVGETPALLVTLGQIHINSGNPDEGNKLIRRASAA